MMDTIKGSCHCGTVTFEYPGAPDKLTSCNCSLCRRVGGLWAYAPKDQIKLNAPVDAVIKYVWGDKSLATVSCKTCGSTTHWEPLEDKAPTARMAVNMRMADPKSIDGVRIRRFDGADTWQFLD
jgi:hypothetical protein